MKKLLVKVIRFFMKVYGRLPLKYHYFMGDILAWIIKNILHYRSDVVMTNLARSFPELKYGELKKIYDEFYRHFGEIVAEFFWFAACDYERLRRKGIVKVLNPEAISEMYDNTPSVTVLSTHCGNWEILGGLPGYDTADGKRLSFEETAISVVYKEMSAQVADRVFALNRISPLEMVGTECEVESKNILRYSIRHKDEKRVYIYPADQAPYWGAGRHPIGEFMHQQTYALIGSMGVAHKLGHSVMYMKMKRVRRGHYEMSFIPICRDASLMSPDDMIRKYYDLLQEEINETPHNWLWSHKRWK